MATLVSAMRATPQKVYNMSPLLENRVHHVVPSSTPSLNDDTIFVAVAKEVKESKLNLIWAIQNSGGRRICILYVHVPPAMIPFMGGKFSTNSVEESKVQTYREIEKQNMDKILNEYLIICDKMGVRSEKLYMEKDCIERGIVELITKNKIQKLVMGAASDRYHSRRMIAIRSKKAMYVCENAPAFCHIQFICKGYLIHTRDRSLERGKSPLGQETAVSSDLGRSPHLRSQSVEVGQNQRTRLTTRAQELLRRMRSTNDHENGGSIASVSSDCSISSSPNLIAECSENDDTLYDQLGQAMAEAENARLDAYQEAIRRRKAEKEAILAILRTKEATMSYEKEMKLRKELEESLVKGKKELDNMKIHRTNVEEQLKLALDQNSSLEAQIASTELKMNELEQKNNLSAMLDMIENYKNERQIMQMQRNNALREAEKLRKTQGEASSTTHNKLQLFSEFSFLEIEEATHNFNPSFKIGEGGYGSVYKGILRQTQVAIKTLHPKGDQGPSEFQQEVEILSKLRHPNLVTLIGACLESWTLIYEYLPNGSLEDRLSCKDNSPPLSWQTRIRIATELCSALLFLHSRRPQCIVHGDLKPSNILLDSNFVSKLSDFGISRVLASCDAESTMIWITDPKGTPVFMDPEFFATGELTPKSDVYSFGIILLRLLTGRQALGLPNVMECALDAGELNSVLDRSAGNWPLATAEELARLALRCCQMNRKNRPDLCSDVWRILEPMRVSCVVSNNNNNNKFGLDSQQPPPYFICPILQEVMQDPHVAADGYTYEAKAIQGWLDSGRDTSPVTNSKLMHRILIPNHSLHSAIQDWLQQSH